MRLVIFLYCGLLLFAGCDSNSHEGPIVQLRFNASADTTNVLDMSGRPEEMIRIPASEALLSTSSNITVSVWAYRRTEQNTALVALDYPTLFLGFHRWQFKWQIQLDNKRRGVCYADKTHRAELEHWYHIAASFDGWLTRLYVDGEEICRDWTFLGTIPVSSAPFTIGGYLDENNQVIDAMDGVLDDVRIYDRALSTQAIRTLWREGMGTGFEIPTQYIE